jgi:hypothetical protein
MRGEIIYPYQKLNSADQKVFRRWLWANTIVGAILLAGLIALSSCWSRWLLPVRWRVPTAN